MIFKSVQVCDWLAKWLIMLGFMDLRQPRRFLRSNVGLALLLDFTHYLQGYLNGNEAIE